VQTAADLGATLRVNVTATNGAGSATASSPVTGVVALAPPAAGTAPSVTGTLVDGATLSTGTGTFGGTAPFAYTYQWQRCDATGASCVAIPGATGATHALTPADVGATLRAAVTATNAVGAATQVSPATGVVAPAPPVSTSAPVVSGVVADGQTLSATTGTFSGTAPLTYAYQWQRCDASGSSCANIAGATSATYAETAADIGATLRVRVTATNPAGSATGTAAATGVVAAVAPTSTVAPSISGTPANGSTLSADHGTFSGSAPFAYAYQWQRCDAAGNSCVDIPGATATGYPAGVDDVGHALRVRVTATNPGGSATATSNPSAPITAPAPANTERPAISGTTNSGATLSATNGTWDGLAPFTYAYQWQQCDETGARCVDIPGATAATYPLTDDDIGQTVRVRVTATNAAGRAEATSAASDVILPDPNLHSTAPPTVTGTPDPGRTLTATPGSWTGTGQPIYSYQWQRCDEAGENCVDVPAATGKDYALTSADIGATMRVVVTARAGSSISTARSLPSPLVGLGGAPDLTGIPGSLVAPPVCADLGVATRLVRGRIVGVGAVAFRIKSGGYVTPTSPLRLTTKLRNARVRAVDYLLDGRRIAHLTKGRFKFGLKPNVIAGRTHRLTARVMPLRGRARSVSALLKPIRCATLFTGWLSFRRTSTVVNLRVDSAYALKTVSFTLPRPVRLRAGTARAAAKAGVIRIFRAGGKRQIVPLAIQPSATPASGRGVVARLTGRTLTLTNLPAGTGVLHVQVAQPRTAFARTRLMRFRASVQQVGPSKTLRTKVRGGSALRRR